VADLEAIKQHVQQFACFCCTCYPQNRPDDSAHHPDCTTWQLLDDIRELVAEVESLVADERRKTREERLTSLGFEEVDEEHRKSNRENIIEALKNKQVSEHSEKYTDIVSDGGFDPR